MKRISTAVDPPPKRLQLSGTMPRNFPFFASFTSSAEISPFWPSDFPTPTWESSYNDDVSIPHYEGASRTFADKQRKGICDDIHEASSVYHHVELAFQLPFFLAQEIPLPPALIRAQLFLSGCNDDRISAFWGMQILLLEKLVLASTETESRWSAQIPPAIRPAAGKVKVKAMLSLMKQANLGGQRWVKQFIFGFPLVGELSQRDVYPPSRKEVLTPIGLPELLQGAEELFSSRACKSGFKNGQALWGEALAQHSAGWLTAPFQLSSEGSPFTLTSSEVNIAFRFGVAQAGKLRACDDLRYSRANLACSALTPIKLISWGHIAQLSRLIASSGKAWHFFKADREAAYKQLPLEFSHSKLAVIALRSPQDKRRYGFFSRTMVFGAIAAVLHYNAFSRLVTELASKILGIPVVCFFDDFGALIRVPLGRKALEIFSKFCQLLGISLKASKSQVGDKVVFLRLEGSFPSPQNSMQISVRLTPDKASKWIDTLKLFLSQGRVGHRDLESLIGKLGFSQTCLFGKFARCHLRALYPKLHRKWYIPMLSAYETSAIRWWIATLRNVSPRLVLPPTTRADWIIYTDAASISEIIAAVVF